MGGPLKGIKVLDLTSVVMGPYAAQILGDYGAEVLKVEGPDGDVMRLSGPMNSPGMGHFYLTTNQNKRSICLDLKKPKGRQIFLNLARESDVLLYNMRPKAMARLALTYDDLRVVNPEIIYVGAFGYGQDGPYADRPAYDDMIQGAAGIPHLISEAGADVPRFAPIVLADRLVGMQTAMAIIGALYCKLATGRGQKIDIPMFENMVSVVLGEHLAGRLFEPTRGPTGYQRSLSRNRRPYATKDGHICVMLYNDKQWKRFLEIVGKPEMIEDERFSSQNNRLNNIDVVYGLVEQELAAKTTSEWIDTLVNCDIPAVPLNTIDDIFDDPHLNAIGFFDLVRHPTEGEMIRMAIPSEWSETQPEHTRHAPLLGEHTGEILSEIGFSEDEVETLFATGVVHSQAERD